MNIPGIPTDYKGVRFRSRLEAKWARFFDLCGREWHYEPFDLNGWIPDFVISGVPSPILVEVKPATALPTAAAEKALAAMAGTDWALREVLLLGVGPFRAVMSTPFMGEYRMVGWLGECWPDPSAPEWNWNEAACGRWSHGIGLCHAQSSYRDRISGEATGNWGEENGQEIDHLWGDACNATQWKAPR